MKFTTLLVLSCFCLKNVALLNCYWSSDYKYQYFSSKTPYEIVRGDIRDWIVKQKGCEAISVWAIMRHGKRNPGINYLQEMKDVLNHVDFIISSYENGNSSLCAQDVQNLRNWKIDRDVLEKPNEISNEGYQELVGIGSRIKEALPGLINEIKTDNYVFRPAFGKRMQGSAQAFVEGLTNNNNLIIENAKNDFDILAPYASCAKYQVEVFRNPDIYLPVAEYLKTVDYLDAKERIEKRLGLNFTLTDNFITAMYDLCRYTWTGITNSPSPWCALFSAEDLMVLEYIGDLKHYYRNGYGIMRYSKVFGQIPLADLLTKFEETKNGKGKKIVSYITHATMMDMILVALNLNKDEIPLTGSHRDMNRKWRTTFLSTFSSNMIAVLNRCNTHSENTYDYNVVFYWNEKPLLDLCNDGVCSWQEFRDIFIPFSNATADFCKSKWKIID